MTDETSNGEVKWIVPAGMALKSADVNVADINSVLQSFLRRLGLVSLHLFNTVIVVTSGKDSIHVASSKHGRGDAVDLRISNFAPEDQPALLLALRVLCKQFGLSMFDESYAPGMGHVHIEIAG
jgi:hypothetical protein